MIIKTFKIYLAAFFLLNFSSLSNAQEEQTNYVAQQLIVTFKPNNNETEVPSFKTQKLKELETLLEVDNYKLSGHKKEKNTYVIHYTNEVYSVDEAVEMYKSSGYFDIVEPDMILESAGALATVPADAGITLQWGLRNTGWFPLAPATAGADMDLILAWDIEQGDPNMVVAIIDSGVKTDHPELANRLWINADETLDNTDSDNNGYIDDTSGGWNFVSDNNNITDSDGHGTGVLGVVGVNTDNGAGYAGINWNCKFMVCKTSTNSTSNTSNVVEAIYYAVDNGAKIINLSMGGGYSTSMSNAVNYAENNDVIVVAAMMNNNNDSVKYPAGFTNTIAVGATNPDDTRSAPFFWSSLSGSNYGSHIDVVAPGNYIFVLNHEATVNYSTYAGGTSQATPAVTGIISLLLSQNPNLTFEEIRTIIRESAEDQVGDPSEDTPGWDQYYGAGRVNAFNALNHSLLSTNDFEAKNTVKIYPNPIETYDNVLTIENLPNGNNKIFIYNSLGQKQFDFTVNNSSGLQKEIVLPKLSSGTYFLKFENTQNLIETLKLIVQ